MNREILFRGKRVDGKGWVYGLPTYLCDKSKNENGNIFKDLYFSNGKDGSSLFKILPDTIGQLHNGLTRKAGTNVFVGDIVKHDLEAGLGQPKRMGIVSEITSIEFDFHYYSNVRLLGNKFDNPELTQQS